MGRLDDASAERNGEARENVFVSPRTTRFSQFITTRFRSTRMGSVLPVPVVRIDFVTSTC